MHRFLLALKIAFKRSSVSGWCDRFGYIEGIKNIPPSGAVLDVGCGNSAPQIVKSIRRDIRYVGIDVKDYNQLQNPSHFADKYIVVAPEGFAQSIAELNEMFDLVVSSHNIEHCHDPASTLQAMAKCIKRGGRMFLSFPCEASLGFPRRRGTLNFYDDDTHRAVPKFDEIVAILRNEGMVLEAAFRRYRPPVMYGIGLLVEPLSALLGVRIFRFTWALYGFESLIWARRQ